MNIPSGSAPGSGTLQVGTAVRVPKTAELIAARLRGQIVRGELQAGETLPSEVQLMEQYGVSRPTLREAFRILETETLISVRRGSRGGAQVTAPDPAVAARHVGLLLQIQGATVEDVYEARIVCESACTRLLARDRTDQDLASLRDCVETLRTAADSSSTSAPDLTRWTELTSRFHQLVIQRSGNKSLAVQGAILQDIVATHLRLGIARQDFDVDESPERFQHTIRSYATLITLVEAHEEDQAELHWVKHMRAAAKYLFQGDLKNTPVVDLFA